MAREELEAFIRDHGVTLSTVFVPWSKSRNAREKHRTLNWRVTVERDGRAVVGPFDYSAGTAYAPGNERYKRSPRYDYERRIAVEWECEHGVAAMVVPSGHVYPAGAGLGTARKRIEPDACDVLASLASDAAALDARGFEDWAAEFGYDADSRAAEKVYRACLEIALQLRAGFGDAVLRALQTACEGY